MCARSTNIIVLKERLAATQALLDDFPASLSSFTAPPSAAAANPQAPHFFSLLTPAQVCSANARWPQLWAVRVGLQQRLAQSRAEYRVVSRALKGEEKMERGARLRKVVEELSSFYGHVLSGCYGPARLPEFEFARLVLDQRTREGVLLNRWFEQLESRWKVERELPIASPPPAAAAAASTTPTTTFAAAAAVTPLKAPLKAGGSSKALQPQGGAGPQSPPPPPPIASKHISAQIQVNVARRKKKKKKSLLLFCFVL
jgi:hypothetical protein